MYDFIVKHQTSHRDDVTEEIKDYFVLPFMALKNDEVYYNEMATKDIISKAITGIGRDTLANVERINSNRYSYKLDLLLFFGRLRMENRFDENRLDRVLRNSPAKERSAVIDAFAKLYPACAVQAKLAILKYIEQKGYALGLNVDHFINQAYQNGYRDMIYYGILARKANQQFASDRR